MIQIVHYDGISWAVIREYPDTPGGRRSAQAKYADCAIRAWQKHGDSNVRIGTGHFSIPGCVYELRGMKQ